MEINWFTVIAQIVNFLILVWLLKRFLYKPVLKAIDERKKKIEARLEEAAMRKAEAKKDQDLFRQKNEDFDKERTVKMNLAQEDVNSEKERLFEEVRNESNALRSKFENSFKQRKQELIDSLKRKTKDEVFAIVGKTLSDLANTNLEDQVINVFIKKLSIWTRWINQNLYTLSMTSTIQLLLKVYLTYRQVLNRNSKKRLDNSLKNNWILTTSLKQNY